MDKSIGVLTIHGTGRRAPHFDLHLQRRLLAELELEVKRDLHFQTVYYQDLIQGRQEELWQGMQGCRLAWRGLRRFLLFYLSDAATYPFKPQAPGSVYRRVHELIRHSVDLLYERLGRRPRPLVIFAHSLGCHVLSNYIWDAQQRRGIWEGEAPTAFQALSTTRLLFTAGCPIPLFVAGLARIEAIRKPNARFQWFNYYDRHDPLGWPLKPLSAGFENAYDRVVTEDIEISVGRWPWQRLSPTGHLHYWTSPAFVRPAARRIASLHGRASAEADGDRAAR